MLSAISPPIRPPFSASRSPARPDSAHYMSWCNLPDSPSCNSCLARTLRKYSGCSGTAGAGAAMSAALLRRLWPQVDALRAAR